MDVMDSLIKVSNTISDKKYIIKLKKDLVNTQMDVKNVIKTRLRQPDILA